MICNITFHDALAFNSWSLFCFSLTCLVYIPDWKRAINVSINVLMKLYFWKLNWSETVEDYQLLKLLKLPWGSMTMFHIILRDRAKSWIEKNYRSQLKYLTKNSFNFSKTIKIQIFVLVDYHSCSIYWKKKVFLNFHVYELMKNKIDYWYE